MRRALLGPAVGDGIGVEAQLFDFGAGGGVGEQEFGFAFGSVLFDGDEHGGAKQNAFVAWLGGDVGAFFEAKAAAEFCGYDNGAAFADAGGIQGSASSSECQEVSIADILMI